MSDIIIIAASNNKNLELAREFEKEFRDQNISSSILDLVDLELPLYTPVEEKKGIPTKVFEIIEIIEKSKGFVFATPEYNGGLPPVLTNFIAWISRSGEKDWRKYFNSKSAAISSFSGSGGFQALISLRTQLSYIGINVIGRQVRATYKEDINLSDIKAVSQLLIRSISNA